MVFRDLHFNTILSSDIYYFRVKKKCLTPKWSEVVVCSSRQPTQCKTSTKWCLCDFSTLVIYYSILKNSRNRNMKGQVYWQMCYFHLGAYLRKCLQVRGPWPLRTSRQGPLLPRNDGKELPPLWHAFWE